MGITRLVRPVLAVDAAANALLAVVVLVAASPLARALGDVAVWPLVVLAALLAVNAVLCGRVARADAFDAGMVRALAIVDVVFALAVLAMAVADPTGADQWMRWLLGAFGVVVVLIAEIKWVAAARRAPGAVARG